MSIGSRRSAWSMLGCRGRRRPSHPAPSRTGARRRRRPGRPSRPAGTLPPGRAALRSTWWTPSAASRAKKHRGVMTGQRRRRRRRVAQPRLGRDDAVAKYDAQRLAVRNLAGAPHGEAGSSTSAVPVPTTTAPQRARPGCARRPRLIRGDPARTSVGGGDASVKGGGELPSHERTTGAVPMGPGEIELLGLAGQRPGTGRRRPLHAASWCRRRREDWGAGWAKQPAHPRRQQRRRARARSTPMRTRLQADVGGAAARGRPAARSATTSACGDPAPPCRPLAHDGAGGVHDHRAQPGIGVGLHAPHRQLRARRTRTSSDNCAGQSSPLSLNEPRGALRRAPRRRVRRRAPPTAEPWRCLHPDFTVGPGVPPGQPLRPKASRVADCHRRFGLHRPEHDGHTLAPLGFAPIGRPTQRTNFGC